MPTEGEVLGAVEVQIGADTTPAEQATTGLVQKILDIGGRMTQGNPAFVSWGTTASKSIQGVTNSLSQINETFGESGPFGTIINSLQGMEMGLENVTRSEESAESAGRKFVALGPALSGLGTIALGLGGAFTALSAPLQESQAELQNAVQNTGQSMDQYSSKFTAAESAAAKFGFSQTDVQKALAELTVETKSPQEALNELAMTETVAAARHTDLGHAARYMGQAHAGLFRVFRQFGIEIQQVKDPAKELTSAEKELGNASDALKSKQQALADFEAKTAEQMQANQQKWAEKVQSTEQAATDASQHYQDLQSQYAQTEQDRIAQTAQAVEDAAQRKIDADQAVADLEAKLDGNSAQALDNKEALATAEQRMNEDRVRVAQTSGAAQQSAIQQLQSAEAAYHKLQRDQAAQHIKDQQDLAKAKQTQTDATDKLAKANTAAAKAQQGLTPQEQEALNKAQENAVKTANAYQQALAGQAAAQSMTLAQQQQDAKLKEEVAKASDKVTVANQKVTKAKQDQATADAAFHQLETEFMQREGGLLQKRANTWAGHIASIKAHIVDLMQTLSSSIAPAATGIGIGALLLGQGIRAGRGIRRIGQHIRGGPADAVAEETEDVAQNAQKAASAFDPIAQGAKQAAQDVKDNIKGVSTATEDIATEVGGSAGKISGLFGRIGGVVRGLPSAFSVMGSGIRGAMSAMVGFVTSPVGLIILAIGALILIGVEVVKHWHTISHDLSVAWDALFAAGKRVFGDIEHVVKIAFNLVKGHFIEIAAFIVGGPLGLAIAWIATHWHQTWDGIKTVARDAVNAVITIIQHLVSGVLTGIDDMLKAMGHLPGPFGAPFRAAAKHVEDFRKTINTTFDNLKLDSDKKSQDIGKSFGQGIAQGMTQSLTAVQAAASGISTQTLHQMRQQGEIHSPSRLFAREVGHPIALGVAMGMETGQEAVLTASRGMMQRAIRGTSGLRVPPPSVNGSPVGQFGQPISGSNRPDGETTPDRVIHYEPHFHQEIDPQHVLHEFMWRDVQG